MDEFRRRPLEKYLPVPTDTTAGVTMYIPLSECVHWMESEAVSRRDRVMRDAQQLFNFERLSC